MSDPFDSDVGPHDAADHTCADCDTYADGGAECEPVSIAESFVDRAREYALRGPRPRISLDVTLTPGYSVVPALSIDDVADHIRRTFPV